ncbi:hypothetical protein [Enterococcus gallinarum]|uniref:hypothetical protein n=1 Tax=Enterococcus gallinarum TaxID=1353 RepID=UPI0015C58200|nr:hypothetical protein [Enterococcus gallinarum]NQE01854.1 hypothetical protein [Enterococcus gallinarum]
MNILEFAKREFEKQYDCTMTVSVNKAEKVGSVTKSKWTDAIRNHPCRISQKQLSPVSDGNVAGVIYNTMLYCDPELVIPAGSRISITDTHGKSRDYKRSAEGFSSYHTHQEIIIVREVQA